MIISTRGRYALRVMLDLAENGNGEYIAMKKIAERLTKLRGDRSREDVAKAIGVSVSAICMYENGTRIPRDNIKIKIAQFYNRSVQDIFFD